MLGVEALCLLLSIQHVYVRRHLSIRQPRQKLARAVALVSSNADGCNEALFRSFQHLARRNNFLAEACWSGHDAGDDAASIVDQIVVIVSELGSSSLCSTGLLPDRSSRSSWVASSDTCGAIRV